VTCLSARCLLHSLLEIYVQHHLAVRLQFFYEVHTLAPYLDSTETNKDYNVKHGINTSTASVKGNSYLS
jgi:hypothetical protein